MPNSIHDSPKLCNSCCVLYPVPTAYFGKSRHMRDLLNVDCKACRSFYSQQNKLKNKPGIQPRIADTLNRILFQHNQYVLKLALLRGRMECLAFSTTTHERYTCVIEPMGAKYSIAIFNLGGAPVFSRLEDFDEGHLFAIRIAKALKGFCIRIELDELSLHRAFKEIYYI